MESNNRVAKPKKRIVEETTENDFEVQIIQGDDVERRSSFSSQSSTYDTISEATSYYNSSGSDSESEESDTYSVVTANNIDTNGRLNANSETESESEIENTSNNGQSYVSTENQNEINIRISSRVDESRNLSLQYENKSDNTDSNSRHENIPMKEMKTSNLNSYDEDEYSDDDDTSQIQL